MAADREKARRDAERHSGSIQKASEEEVRVKRGRDSSEKAEANPDRLPLSHCCHYFVIMVVGASFHVLLITDKGLSDVSTNTKTELNQRRGKFSWKADACFILFCLLLIARSCKHIPEYFTFM